MNRRAASSARPGSLPLLLTLVLTLAFPSLASAYSATDFFGSTPAGQPTAGSHRKFEEVAPADDGQLSTTTSSTFSTSALSGNFERQQISTSSGYITLRGEQREFVVGLGRNSWGIDIARNRSSTQWAWGYVTGGATNPVNKCLYAEFAYLKAASTSPTKDCSGTNDLMPLSYMVAWNGNRNGVNCFPNEETPDPDDRKCDGTNVTIDPAKCPAGAPVYPNVQPWTPNAARAAADYTIPAGATVKWRYITQDWRHTMMRYLGAKPYAQDWGFIDATCISNYGYYEWSTTA
jgi:hypothetical protein